MFKPSVGGACALLALSLVGCAVQPLNRPMPRDVAAAAQPVEVKLGVKQPELYADFEPSMAGAAAAASCGAVPGIGILLAAACGATLGAVDATVNAERAKVAEETIRPLKDAIVDVQVEQLLLASTTDALKSVPVQVSTLAVTKVVDDKAYEETFRASTANSVMYVNFDYRISRDFGTLEMTAHSLLYPRAAAARTAAGQAAALPANEPLLPLQNAAFRANTFYRLQLPKAAQPQDYIARWQADGAQLLRTGLQQGSAELGRILADELRRVPGPDAEKLPQVDAAPGIKAGLVAERNGGRLLRYPDGALHFVVTVPPATATAAAAAPASAQ